MEEQTYYLVFAVDRIPDLTLTKYSVLDGSSVDDIIEKHGVFLRQLHRLGSTSGVYFHLLYYFDPDERIQKGHHLSVVFYATSNSKRKLEGIREFLTTSVLSSYYDFHCYEVTSDFHNDVLLTADGREENVVVLTNIANQVKAYGISHDDVEAIRQYQVAINSGKIDALSCEIASDADAVLSLNSLRVWDDGRVLFPRKYVLAKRMRISEKRLWLYADATETSISEGFEYDLPRDLEEALSLELIADDGTLFICYFEPDGTKIVEIGRQTVPCDSNGNILGIQHEMERKFTYSAFLTKKDYYLPAQNRLNTDDAGEVHLFSIMEWEPSENGRLYNVLKLMEGYNRTAALRIDIFPVEHTQTIRQMLPYAETRRRISDRVQGKDDNSETIIKSWDKYLQNLMKFPQFFANVVAFSDSQDIAVMLADSVAAEAVESGTYIIEHDFSSAGFSVYHSDGKPLEHLKDKEKGNYVAPILSLYTLEELRPMFSFPILYPGESIECLKETDPKGFREKDGETISLGISSLGYNVEFPVSLFKKHAFIAGVPGAGKTNTMLHLVTSLWRDTEEKIPFLVLEPAKQEYRALAKIKGMEALRIFSPGADTFFPLHINPFQFPVGLTLAEHIANLNAVFAGAFELPPPSPHFIDTCIEKVYLAKGWNVNERNTLDENGHYRHDFPTLQELYESLEVAVKNSHYQGETLGNLQSVLEVRVGSLLKREIGNVYNVRESILKPEEWLDVPAIIELEALGEGPANFMSLLLSTLIRETLKVRKTSSDERQTQQRKKTLNHVIFYEEAHNLIGPDTDSPIGDSVDPKISATKYLVKMLAEVRALGEGIVIADQLPTVMAPEVLKNTGLKIAHRITAQDDRNLLGSTMSASPDQLEEQGTFGTGWALIFYEDLQKPYKMKVHEWDIQNKERDKYESPTNRQLFSILRENSVYQNNLLRSAKIMKDKMEGEYRLLRERAVKLKEEITKEYVYIQSMLTGIENQENRSAEESSNVGKAQAKNETQKQRLVYEEKKAKFIQKYGRELHMLCWDFTNQYFASITLAKNYDSFSDLLYAASISGFLSLFEMMRSLVDVPEFAKIIVSETQNAMSDVERYVSLDVNSHPILGGTAEYDQLVFASGYYWTNQMYLRQQELTEKAKRIVARRSDREKNLYDFCHVWYDQFERLYMMSQQYAEAADRIIEKIRSEADAKFFDNPDEYGKLTAQAENVRKNKNAMYISLHTFVLNPIKKEFKKLVDADRILFLKASKPIREKHLQLVNYYDSKAETKLSLHSEYTQFRESATVIANIDLLARLESNRCIRAQKIEELLSSNSEREKNEIIVYLRDLYDACFKMYSSYDVQLYSYKIILVDFYLEYLESMMNLGKMAVSRIMNNEPSIKQIQGCNSVIQQLRSQNVLSDSQKASWDRIMRKWSQTIKTYQ